MRSEGACTAADVISRRTRLAFLDVDSALKALPRVIDVMAEELSWSDARREHEWTETVHFLRSMGLEEARMAVTRQEVLSGDAKAQRTRRDDGAAASANGVKVGSGRKLEAPGALASGA